MTNKDFVRVDGLCHDFWGWGVEDVELCEAIHREGIKINRPQNITTGRKGTFLHVHSRSRIRDRVRCFQQDAILFNRRKPNTGLKTTKYTILDVQEHSIDGSQFTLINVEVPCDKKVTPWCMCETASGR